MVNWLELNFKDNPYQIEEKINDEKALLQIKFKVLSIIDFKYWTSKENKIEKFGKEKDKTE
jgi:hypothetical protein